MKGAFRRLIFLLLLQWGCAHQKAERWIEKRWRRTWQKVGFQWHSFVHSNRTLSLMAHTTIKERHRHTRNFLTHSQLFALWLMPFFSSWWTIPHFFRKKKIYTVYLLRERLFHQPRNSTMMTVSHVRYFISSCVSNFSLSILRGDVYQKAHFIYSSATPHGLILDIYQLVTTVHVTE